MGSHEQLTLVSVAAVAMVLGAAVALAAAVIYRLRRHPQAAAGAAAVTPVRAAPAPAAPAPAAPAPAAPAPNDGAAALDRARSELAADRAEVDRRLARAQRSERAQNLLLSKLSHDLRSPLGTVVTLSQLLVEGSAGPLAGELRKYVEVINRSSESLLALLGTVLDLASLESGRLEIAVSPVNKIILGDWIWHYNRGWLDPRSVWHNFKGKSLVNMLFGDGHAQGYRFPIKPESDPFWSARPNPTNQWW